MFGTKQPSCEWFDWERQRLPCKDFFAIFQHVPSWSFERLPKEYRDYPFFSVTTCIISTANANTIYSTNTTSSTTSTANTCIILAVNATTNTNLAQPNEKDDEVEFVKISYRSALKAGKFHLSEQDIRTVPTGDWLTDHIVGAAQSVLREQFPHARGLENTTSGPIFNFSVQKGQFSQILNTGSHHWVLVSTVGCYTPSVFGKNCSPRAETDCINYLRGRNQF